MSAYECYQHYSALKLHFTKQGYDYFKYNHKVSSSPATFETRKDKIFFMKVAKHEDPVKYMLSNIVINPKVWIRDIAYSKEAEQVYQNWLKRNQSFGYVFSQEIDKLDPNFDKNFKVSASSGHPPAMRLYLRGDISLETLVALVDSTKCSKHWSKSMEHDPIWQDLSNLIVKYRPFLNYDRQRIRKILVDKFSNE
jgi:hypothetical protein